MTRFVTKASSLRRGFSILELVLVVVIIAITAAIAVPRYVSSINFYRTDLAAKRIATDLAMARDNAWTTGAQRTATFDAAANTYSMPGIRSLERSTADFAVDLSGRPYYCDLVSVNFQGRTSVTFDAYGLPNRGGQVVVRSGQFQKTIVLNPYTGNATIQ